VALLEAQAEKAGGVERARLLARAAVVAETHLGNPTTIAVVALELRRASAEGGDPLAQLWLARLYLVAGERAKAIPLLRKLAAALPAASAAPLFLAVGIAELAAGQMREAEDSLKEAVRRQPHDPLARAALALIYRRASRWRDLADALGGLVEHVAVVDAKVAALRELGKVTASKLGDVKAARARLEQAQELAPDDVGVLAALADLAGETGDWNQAVALRERVIEQAGRTPEAAQALLELAEIEEKHRKNDAAARAALERALAINDSFLEALRAIASLHRKHKRQGELAAVLRRELELIDEPARRLALHLELAKNAETEADMVEAADQYRDALRIDAGHTAALAAFERLVR
jgi:tetratricopeptide (TPR) repeat protein